MFQEHTHTVSPAVTGGKGACAVSPSSLNTTQLTPSLINPTIHIRHMRQICPLYVNKFDASRTFLINAPTGTDACSSIRATAFSRRDGVIPL